MLGQTIGGRYSIVRLLGQGGMGAVYEGRHTGTERRVAVKVITAHLSHREGSVARFQVEARAAGRIDSQYIAQVLDVGTDDRLGAPFMVMEYLSGEDLQQLMERLGPLPPSLALRIVAQACLGLEKAHASGVIHRDIKPANIFLAERDGGEVVVKLLDFGIAKIKEDETSEGTSQPLTRTGNLIGSPHYMSPEQARGGRKIDARSDVWSLGVVLYNALTGHTPYQDIDGMGDLIITICTKHVGLVQDAAPWLDADIARVVQRALSLSPAERYQRAQDMFEPLRALIPGGLAIDRSMLVPLDEVTRSTIQPRLPAGETLTQGSPLHLGAATRESDADASSSMKITALTGIESVRAPAPAGRSKVLIAAAAAAAVLAVAVAATRGSSPAEAPAAEPARAAPAPPIPSAASPREAPSSMIVTPAPASEVPSAASSEPATADSARAAAPAGAKPAPKPTKPRPAKNHDPLSEM